MQCARPPTLPQLHSLAHAERHRSQAWLGRSFGPDRRPLNCTSVTSQPEPEGVACKASHCRFERPQRLSSPQPDLRRSLPAQPQSAVQHLLPLSTAALLAAAAASALCPEPALAWQLRQEPSNALSLPTWAIHVSSVYEWGLAMGLMWKYADVTGEPRLNSAKSHSSHHSQCCKHTRIRSCACISLSSICNGTGHHAGLQVGASQK